MAKKSLLFQEFKRIYPKRKNWVSAENVWNKINADQYWHLIRKDIKKMKELNKLEKKYIPYPARYLNEHRWESTILEIRATPITNIIDVKKFKKLIMPTKTRAKREPIESIKLPRKVTNVLKMYGITTVAALKRTTPKKILSLPGIGIKSLSDIRDRI